MSVGGETDDQREKFLVELEFVQCLANPLYINWLATEVRARLASRRASEAPGTGVHCGGAKNGEEEENSAPLCRGVYSVYGLRACWLARSACCAGRDALLTRGAAGQGYLLDGKFVRYLDYLQYWKQPQYSKFLVYPHCLRFLDLLQHEDIRKKLTEHPNFHTELADQQFWHWLHRRRNTHFDPAAAKAQEDAAKQHAALAQ